MQDEPKGSRHSSHNMRLWQVYHTAGCCLCLTSSPLYWWGMTKPLGLQTPAHMFCSDLEIHIKTAIVLTFSQPIAILWHQLAPLTQTSVLNFKPVLYYKTTIPMQVLHCCHYRACLCFSKLRNISGERNKFLFPKAQALLLTWAKRRSLLAHNLYLSV